MYTSSEWLVVIVTYYLVLLVVLLMAYEMQAVDCLKLSLKNSNKSSLSTLTNWMPLYRFLSSYAHKTIVDSFLIPFNVKSTLSRSIDVDKSNSFPYSSFCACFILMQSRKLF